MLPMGNENEIYRRIDLNRSYILYSRNYLTILFIVNLFLTIIFHRTNFNNLHLNINNL